VACRPREFRRTAIRRFAPYLGRPVTPRDVPPARSRPSGRPHLARRRSSGVWLGLAALRQLRGRERLVALVVLGVLAQIVRIMLVLHAVGVNTSIFNAIAVLIISVSLSLLPLGAGVGATAVILILGAHGLSATAAGGVLLTVRHRNRRCALLRGLGMWRPRPRARSHARSPVRLNPSSRGVPISAGRPLCGRRRRASGATTIAAVSTPGWRRSCESTRGSTRKPMWETCWRSTMLP
jgi:hypothetical protein